MIYVLYGLAAIIGFLILLRLSVVLTRTSWAKSGFALTAIVVIVLVTPGSYAAERSLKFLENARQDSDPRAVDKAREKVRADLLRRADLYLRYPAETNRAHRLGRSLVR